MVSRLRGSGSAVSVVFSSLLGAFGASCGGETVREIINPPAELGEIEVTWSLARPSGEPVSCSAVGVSEVYVAVGGIPKSVACGEDARVRFPDLPPGRYPVVVQLRVLQAVFMEHLANVVLAGGEVKTHPVAFEIEEGAADRGDLLLTWRVDGQPATLGMCMSVGARSVLVRSRPTSISQFEATGECTDGELRVQGLRRGDYEVIVTLRDWDGEALKTAPRSFTIQRRAQTTVNVNFDFSPVEPTALFGRWTVTGSAAADACDAVGGETVEMTLFSQNQQQLIAVGTATAACSAGELHLGNLPAPRLNDPSSRYRATLQLFGFNQVPLALEVVEDLVMVAARTTTISVDFPPSED